MVTVASGQVTRRSVSSGEHRTACQHRSTPTACARVCALGISSCRDAVVHVKRSFGQRPTCRICQDRGAKQTMGSYYLITRLYVGVWSSPLVQFAWAGHGMSACMLWAQGGRPMRVGRLQHLICILTLITLIPRAESCCYSRILALTKLHGAPHWPRCTTPAGLEQLPAIRRHLSVLDRNIGVGLARLVKSSCSPDPQGDCAGASISCPLLCQREIPSRVPNRR